MPASNKTANSVDTDNEAYVGVDDIYKNDAYGDKTPLLSDNDDVRAAEEAAAQTERDRLAAGVGFLGYNPDTQHPSTAQKADDKFNENNRAIHDALAASAKEQLAGSDSSETPAPEADAAGATEASTKTPAKE